MKVNLPETGQERIVIIGGGFAGLTMARKLAKSDYQVVLIDKNNYHQFQPLFYQVAMAGLEPSSIVFPLRKSFQKNPNVFIRVTEVRAVEPALNRLQTDLGIVNYDHLVIATGADTNFFGNEHIAQNAIPMKSVSEALYLRNRILDDYEKALSVTDYEDRQSYVDIVIVGGGPTGTEVAGALAEMRKFVLPKDYGELDTQEIDIILIEGAPRLLPGMSEDASQKALDFLKDLQVEVKLNTMVTDYDGDVVNLQNGDSIRARKVIWAAGVKGNIIEGMPEELIVKGNRVQVDRYHRVKGMENIYAIGDISYMEENEFPDGHPQVAQVALQHGENLAKNFLKPGKARQFHYKDLGSMATIGRKKAVADLPNIKFQGAFAWLVWLFIHLYQLVGVRNRVVVFLNWIWNYVFYDQSLRLIIKPKITDQLVEEQQDKHQQLSKG